MEVMSLEEARKAGALAFFEQKYTEKVKVYTVGGFSKEVCGGPHVKNTGEIGKIEIYKEEAVGSGKRRIYARIAGLDG
jgi:alanyl-tRNA synthetase